RGLERLLRDDRFQQLIERDVREVFAAEDRVERHGALATELQVLVQEEEAFVHGAQNVRRLLARRICDHFFLTQIAGEIEEDCTEEQQRGGHAADLNAAQDRGLLRA